MPLRSWSPLEDSQIKHHVPHPPTPAVIYPKSLNILGAHTTELSLQLTMRPSYHHGNPSHFHQAAQIPPGYEAAAAEKRGRAEDPGRVLGGKNGHGKGAVGTTNTVAVADERIAGRKDEKAIALAQAS